MKKGLINKMIAVVVSVLVVLLIFVFILFYVNKAILLDCEEYEKVPYRYSGGFFGGQVRTIEGNHDGYWDKCIKGTKPLDLLFKNGKKRK